MRAIDIPIETTKNIATAILRKLNDECTRVRFITIHNETIVRFFFRTTDHTQTASDYLNSNNIHHVLQLKAKTDEA